jgi:hypothetical protein
MCPPRSQHRPSAQFRHRRDRGRRRQVPTGTRRCVAPTSAGRDAGAMARWWKRPHSRAPAAFVDTVDADTWWFADGEELAEGAVEDLLRTLGPTLAARGVIYDVATISAPETGRYTIAIDGEEVHLYDEASWSAGTDDHPWGRIHDPTAPRPQPSTRRRRRDRAAPHPVRGRQRGHRGADRPGARRRLRSEPGHRSRRDPGPATLTAGSGRCPTVAR